MTEMNVQGFVLRLDRAYEFADHMWVEVLSPESVRVGMDSLGIETAGTLAQLQFFEEGTVVTRRDPVGSLEAEKFVGPVVAPLSGTVTAVNVAAMADPSIVEVDPYTNGWMVELTPSALDEELPLLTQGDDPIVAEFERKISEYRRDGVLAE